MQLIVGKITSIFLIVGIGFIANKAGILPMSANRYIVNLLMKITLPCMILASITSNELESGMISATVQTFAGTMAYFAAATLIGYFLCKKIFREKNTERIGIYTFSFAAINNGFIGFPITMAVFGSEILYLMVINNIGLTLYLYSFGAMILGLGTEDGKFSAKGFVNSLKNVNTIAAFIGIVMLLAGVHFPVFVFDCIDMVGSSTTPLSMLLVGMQLGQCEFDEVIKNRKLVGLSLLKVVILPVVTFFMINWLPFTPEVKTCVIFAASLPVAVAVVPIVSDQNRDSLVAAEAVAISTLFSMVSIPLVSSFLTEFYGV